MSRRCTARQDGRLAGREAPDPSREWAKHPKPSEGNKKMVSHKRTVTLSNEYQRTPELFQKQREKKIDKYIYIYIYI